MSAVVIAIALAGCGSASDASPLAEGKAVYADVCSTCHGPTGEGGVGPALNEVAATCAIQLKIRMPVVVDKVDDEIARAYGALPDRLYLIGRGGHVAFRGAPGPFGFQPEALEAAIEKELGGS